LAVYDEPLLSEDYIDVGLLHPSSRLCFLGQKSHKANMTLSVGSGLIILALFAGRKFTGFLCRPVRLHHCVVCIIMSVSLKHDGTDRINGTNNSDIARR